MIVASQFGWEAVSREPMDMYDLLLAAQLMSEERVGTVLRKRAREQAGHEHEARSRLLRAVE